MTRPRTPHGFIPRSNRARNGAQPHGITAAEGNPWVSGLSPTQASPTPAPSRLEDPASVATPPRREPEETWEDVLLDELAEQSPTEVGGDATEGGTEGASENLYTDPAPTRPTHDDPEPAPSGPAPGPVPIEREEFDPDDVFSAAAVRRRGLGRTGLAQVVLSLSGSGGVGKTTFSLALAQRAADRGKRVILLDCNVGQGDISAFLRVHNSEALPTMYDAVVLGSGNLRKALIAPKQLQNERDPRLAPVGFALVQAPTMEELQTRRITSVHLAQLIRQAQELADLVVVDTQIVEPDDPRGMLGSTILPALGQGAWALTLTSLSAASISNTVWLMDHLREQGIAESHIMSVLNRVPVQIELQQDRLTRALARRSVHLGTAWDDDELLLAMNRGEPIGDQRTVAHLLDQVLEAVFNIEPTSGPYDPHATPEPRPGLFRRRRRS